MSAAPFNTNAMTLQQRILAALSASDPAYVMKTMQMRSSARAGSFIPDVMPEELLEKIKTADWKPFTHPALMEGTTAFRADIAGVLGIVPVSALPPETEILLADQKGTGFYSAHVVDAALAGALPQTDHSILILGPDNGKEVFYTFHPGDPVVPHGMATNGAGAKKTTAGALAKQYPDITAKITDAALYASLGAEKGITPAVKA